MTLSACAVAYRPWIELQVLAHRIRPGGSAGRAKGNGAVCAVRLNAQSRGGDGSLTCSVCAPCLDAPEGHGVVATGAASESSSERNPWKKASITSAPAGAEGPCGATRTDLRMGESHGRRISRWTHLSDDASKYGGTPPPPRRGGFVECHAFHGLRVNPLRGLAAPPWEKWLQPSAPAGSGSQCLGSMTLSAYSARMASTCSGLASNST